MPCNSEVDIVESSSEHQNGCEMNGHRSSAGHSNGTHCPHRQLFHDTNGFEESNHNGTEHIDEVAIEHVRLIYLICLLQFVIETGRLLNL